MNPLLVIAYDLKHQIECLPREHSQSAVVDKHTTTMTMQRRIEHIVKYLENEGLTVNGDEIIFDEEVIPLPHRSFKWGKRLEMLNVGRSFVAHYNAKSAIFQAARKLGIKVKSSQIGLKKDQLRIWRLK